MESLSKQTQPPLQPSTSTMVAGSDRVDKAAMMIESQNGRMRKQWDATTCKELGISDRYSNVSVLMIRWEEQLDHDLKCKKEVDELDELFRTEFGFNSKVLALSNRRRPQGQLNYEMSRFVHEHDGPHRSTLLIIYYSGHGVRKSEGDLEELLIEGKPDPGLGTKDKWYPTAKWKQAEQSLVDAEADVLMIMDCCSAGTIMKSASDGTRCYETLLAASSNLTTPKPGPRSYSRALITSLQGLLDESRSGGEQPFDTFELHNRIARFQKYNHKAQMFQRTESREGNQCRHIRLAPLAKPSKSQQEQPSNRPASTLRLQLVLSEKSSLTDDEIARLAAAMAKGAKEAELDIVAIDWIGFAPQQPQLVRRLAFTTWLVMRAMIRWREKKARLKRPFDSISEDPELGSVPEAARQAVDGFLSPPKRAQYRPLPQTTGHVPEKPGDEHRSEA